MARRLRPGIAPRRLHHGAPDLSRLPVRRALLYPYVFETPPGAEGGILADYERVPNPFVLAL